jgi:hypothetical protein
MKAIFAVTLLLVFAFLTPESQAQGVIQQFGNLIAGDLIMSQGNNRGVDAGNAVVPTLPGTRPFGVGIVNSGFGFCQWNTDPGANTAWNQLCWGFNSSGAGVINYSNMNTTANNLLLQVNGNTDLTLNNFGASGVTQPCSDASTLLATDAYTHNCVSITGGITAASNSVLEATPSTATTSIVRLGFDTPGDSPSLQFIPSNAACSLNAGAGDGGSQVPSADGKCWLASFPSTGADASEFEAVGDGTYTGSTGTDNSVALQNWLNYGIIVGNKLTLQCKTYMFRTPLAVAAIPISLHGGGSGCGGLRYFGSSTTANLITMGTVGTPTNTPTISGLRVSSATMMTGGTGLTLNSPNQAVLDDVSMNTQFGDFPATLWNGLAIVNGSVKYTNFDDNGQNDVIQCYTASGATLESVDERIAGPGKIAEGAIGFHQGGGCGGVVVGANVDVIANTQNIVQDNTLNASAPNSQLFMHGVLDTPTEDNLVVNDTVQGGGQELIFDGWAASAPRYGIRIEAYPHGIVHIPSGQIIANVQDGIRLEDNTASLVIGAPLIDSNGSAGGGYGLDCTVAVNITGMNSLPFNNYAGHDINATNCHSGGVLSSSAVSWIPGLTFASGSGWTYEANVGSFQVVGGVATMNFYIQFSALGTASGQASLNLPVTCLGNSMARGDVGMLSKATGMQTLLSWPIGLSADGANAALFTELNVAQTASQQLTAANFTASSAIEGQLSCPIY